MRCDAMRDTDRPSSARRRVALSRPRARGATVVRYVYPGYTCRWVWTRGTHSRVRPQVRWCAKAPRRRRARRTHAACAWTVNRTCVRNRHPRDMTSNDDAFSNARAPLTDTITRARERVPRNFLSRRVVRGRGPRPRPWLALARAGRQTRARPRDVDARSSVARARGDRAVDAVRRQ